MRAAVDDEITPIHAMSKDEVEAIAVYTAIRYITTDIMATNTTTI